MCPLLLRRASGPALVVGLFAATAPLLPSQQFTDMTATANLVVGRDSVTFGAGLCVADFDGDGDQDVVCANTVGLPMKYWRNDGGFNFTDLSGASGLGNTNIVHQLTAADVDNDGDKDLFVANWQTPPQLFINNGSGVFVDEAAARGLTSVSSNFSAAFADFDHDGWLDLYLGNRIDPNGSPFPGDGDPNILYWNTGNGVFVDGSSMSNTNVPSATFAAAVADFDEDGELDIFTANDKGYIWFPNDVLRGLGGGAFTPHAAAINADIGIDGMGIDYTDLFNDGGVDYYCSDAEPDHHLQVWSPSLGRYLPSQSTFAVEGGGVGWHVQFSDFNNDGWHDIYVVQETGQNLLFRNPGQPVAAGARFTEIGLAAGVGHPLGFSVSGQHTSVCVDLDNDGDIDLLNRMTTPGQPGLAVHRNDTDNPNWITVIPEGVVSNRDSFNARVEVQVAANVTRQWIRSGTGFLSDSDRRAHFGLDSALQADRVTVRWPSGAVSSAYDVPGAQFLALTEPVFTAPGVANLGASVPMTLSTPHDVGAIGLVLLSFSESPAGSLPDGVELPIAVDILTTNALEPGNPLLMGGWQSVPATGQITATFQAPPVAALSGLTIYASGATLDSTTLRTRSHFERAVPVLLQ